VVAGNKKVEVKENFFKPLPKYNGKKIRKVFFIEKLRLLRLWEGGGNSRANLTALNSQP
jgi:hypothetical protein